ncbi:hypothetical protein MRX96_016951 [Rhipicephalus microplus]
MKTGRGQNTGARKRSTRSASGVIRKATRSSSRQRKAPTLEKASLLTSLAQNRSEKMNPQPPSSTVTVLLPNRSEDNVIVMGAEDYSSVPLKTSLSGAFYDSIRPRRRGGHLEVD